MPKVTYKIIVIVVLSLCFSGIFANDASTTTVANQNKLSDADVLAEYTGGKITRKDLDDKVSKLPPQVQGRYKTVDGQTQILEIMATEEIFYVKALQLNIQSEPSILEKINNGKKQFYIQEYYKRNVVDKVSLTDQDKLDFYRENEQAYFLSPYISIYYIQVADEANGMKAFKELSDGADFETVSDTYNTNTYAKGLKGRVKNIRLNGHIPGVGNDAKLDSLINIASMDQSKIFGPVQTTTGWHIFKVFERVEGRQKPYEEVVAEIEQRLRPIKEAKMLEDMMATLKIKYSVVIDSTLLKSIDLRNLKANTAIEGFNVVTSKDKSVNLTIKQIIERFEKLSPQEQVFYIKDGGAQKVINQELTRDLMYLDGVALRYEDHFKDNPEYVQMQRYHILQEAFKRLVLDRINITSADARVYYDSKIDAYTTPESRAIEILWFDNLKAANKAWKQYTKAIRKNKSKDIEKALKLSTKPDKSVLDNIYNNGIVTSIGPDPEFSSRIWNMRVDDISDVFTTVKGDIVFFRVLRDNPAVVKPFTEVEPRIYGTLKKEAEKTMQEQVKEELFLEFGMKKYPERIRLLLSAQELFDLADNAARQRKFNDALVYYDQIINNYVNNTDDYKAYFMKAFLVTEEMNNKDAGLDLFKAFIMKYPSGELNESAQFMIDELEGKHEAQFEDTGDAE